MLNGDKRRLQLAYSLLFTLPGTPVLRYGDELGMGDDLRLKERNCGRTPMQWSTEPNAGFSRAKKTVLPVIAKGPYGYEKVNAADQRRDPESLLNWTERMIRMRKEVPELGWGDAVETELRLGDEVGRTLTNLCRTRTARPTDAACIASSWIHTGTTGTGSAGSATSSIARRSDAAFR
jgi:glycosidase